jgi:drug/metabolite transporter (DMT)-like permease
LLLKQNKDVILAGLECGIFITLGYICQSLALDSISSGKCAFICSLTVVVVPVVSAVIYGKPIKPLNILAAVIALSGVSVLEGMIDFNSLLGIEPAMADAGASAIAATPVEAVSAMASTSVETAANAGPLGFLASNLGVSKGDILALGQPLGFGYTFTRIEYYQKKFEDVPNRVLTIAAAQCVAVGFLSFLWVLYDYGGSLPNFEYLLEPHRLATIGWTGIVTTVFAIFLQGMALQTASATDAAIAFASEPVWASGFGFLLLNEKLGTNSYIGGAIILMACLVGSASDFPMFNGAEAVDVAAVSADDSSNEEDSKP